MFSIKAVLTTLIGTSIAGSLIAFPVRANENTLAQQQDESEINLDRISYSDYGDRDFNEPSDSLRNIIGFTGLAIGTGVVGYQVSKTYKPSLVGSLPTLGNNSNATLLTRANPKLRREILRLVHNQAIAERLMDGTSLNHPERSANWIAEKVIYDLKRDR